VTILSRKMSAALQSQLLRPSSESPRRKQKDLGFRPRKSSSLNESKAEQAAAFANAFNLMDAEEAEAAHKRKHERSMRDR
jgi:hypothetical protein